MGNGRSVRWNFGRVWEVGEFELGWRMTVNILLTVSGFTFVLSSRGGAFALKLRRIVCAEVRN